MDGHAHGPPSLGWATAEAGVDVPDQRTWLAHADISGNEVHVGPSGNLADVFGLPHNWLDRDSEWPD